MSNYPKSLPAPDGFGRGLYAPHQIGRIDAPHAALLHDDFAVYDHRLHVRRLAAVNQIGNQVMHGPSDTAESWGWCAKEPSPT